MKNDPLRERICDKYNLRYERNNNPLKGMKEAVDALDNPHRRYKSVHVTGTKGAGSTSDIIAGILEKSGYKVGKFSGIGIGDGVRDKFMINGEKIDKEEFINLADDVIKAVVTRDEWDIIVLMALEWFSTHNVDVAVLEAGVGGRWDSTNIIRADLSVVTNAAVVPEHENLGDTPAEVAYRKVGIAEPNSVVVSNGSEAVNKTVARESDRISAKHIVPDEPVVFKQIDEEDVLEYEATYNGVSVKTPIKAEYLCENVDTAVAGLSASEFKIDEDSVLSVLSELQILGRCEFINSQPDFVLDGAHNGYAIRKVASDILTDINSKKILLFSAAKNRWDEMTPEVTQYVDYTILTNADESKTVDANLMFDKVKGEAEVLSNPLEALRRAEEISEDDDTIVVIGDFTLLETVRPTIVSNHKE